MIINIDILVIENSIVNYFLLYITSQTLRLRKTFKNIIFPALLGGVYVITLILPRLQFLTAFPFKILVALTMIILLFKNKAILFNLKALFIYLMYSMLLAGLCFFIALENNVISDFNGAIYNFSYKSLLLSIIIIYLVLSRLILFIKDRIQIDSLIYAVDIIYKDQKTTVKAFFDTGNELREPVSNLPVMIMDDFDLKNIIDEKEFLYIPYKVVNGQINRLVGFKPNYITVHIGSKLEIREVVIAFCDNRLSTMCEYNALLSRGII